MLPAPASGERARTGLPLQEDTVAKGLNQKKMEKKKPEKSLKEKRADKANKKASKS